MADNKPILPPSTAAIVSVVALTIALLTLVLVSWTIKRTTWLEGIAWGVTASTVTELRDIDKAEVRMAELEQRMEQLEARLDATDEAAPPAAEPAP